MVSGGQGRCLGHDDSGTLVIALTWDPETMVIAVPCRLSGLHNR